MILKELISELDYTLYNGNENVEITELAVSYTHLTLPTT